MSPLPISISLPQAAGLVGFAIISSIGYALAQPNGEADDQAPPTAVRCCTNGECYDAERIEDCQVSEPVLRRRTPSLDDLTYDDPGVPGPEQPQPIDSISAWRETESSLESIFVTIDYCEARPLPGTPYRGGDCFGSILDADLNPVMSAVVYVLGIRETPRSRLMEPSSGVTYRFWLHPHPPQDLILAVDGASLASAAVDQAAPGVRQ